MIVLNFILLVPVLIFGFNLDVYIAVLYTKYHDISQCYIQKQRCIMDEKLKRVYIPMTETGFYILYALQQEQHGYGITQQVKELTGGEITISAGTMYGSLSKMEKDGLIRFTREEDKRKLYLITSQGREILAIELKRIERLYHNSKGERTHGNKNH